ncbi:hypothetical protein QF032_003266 [Streptomyces achromogenes]|uniref:hypothetical protein n=1 Tax=Streptomyces achromogenes TaxID=67255 RepID=UPI002784BFC4|nr:hypothetical protein [Streptomyces achromogenes]MDQ0831422.1 hypothetical protein [Streptomyces achromogenes]
MQVRHALIDAGFHLVGEDAEDRRPGLAVTTVPTGVLVGWTASDGFTSLVKDRPGASCNSMRTLVQAAVSGLLAELGHTVTEPSNGGDLLVLADEQANRLTGLSGDESGLRGGE